MSSSRLGGKMVQKEKVGLKVVEIKGAFATENQIWLERNLVAWL